MMVRRARRRFCVECFEPRVLLAVDFATHEVPQGDVGHPVFGDVADFDGDGDLDILMSVSSDPEHGELVWYENTDGHGDFNQLHEISTFPDYNRLFPAQTYAGDLDSDGDEDVIAWHVVDGSWDETIGWYENTDGLGSFGPLKVLASGDGLHASLFHPVDVDQDDDLDVLYLSNSRIILRENTDGRGNFGPPQTIIEYRRWGGNDRYLKGHPTGDFDGDGDVDMMLRIQQQGTGECGLAWFENIDGAGEFGSEPANFVPVGCEYIANGTEIEAHDLDGDGDLDVLASFRDLGGPFSFDIIVWYENTDGLGTFGPRQEITDRVDLVFSLEAADLDRDGDLDVISASRGDGKIAWYENVNGLGTFGPQQVIQIQSAPVGGLLTVYAADLDGDDDADVLSIFHYASSSQFPDRFFWHENLLPRIPGDANRDGFFDTADLVQVLQAGEYEDGIEDNSTWTEGDWDGDRDFTTSDLVLALQTGLYEVKPEPNASKIAAAVDWLFAQDQRDTRQRAYLP